ncbi:zinc finger protein 782-like [Anopheles merus]|uniref:Protein krueppel n=1 Tax=Anopheles merus TaxID=30066 RepID=A0A182VC54_ANOME|nr:zinc finger protein 782-like [Anopheles merus]
MNEIFSCKEKKHLFQPDFCRLCLSQNGEQTGVFSCTSAAALFERIFHCTGVRLADFPDAPPTVCDGCISQLVICEKFVKLCREVDQKLWHRRQHSAKTEGAVQEQDPANTISQSNDEQAPESKVQQIHVKSDEPSPNPLCDGKSTNEEFYVVEITDAHHEYELDLPGSESIPVPPVTTTSSATDKVKHSHLPVEKQHCSKGRTIGKKSQCTVCGSWQQNLKQHMLVHTGEKRYVCPVCQRAFAQKGNLTYHLNQHTGHCPYRCEQCDKAFKDPQSLRSHKLTHTNERKFKCDVCEDTFKYRSSLVVHMRYHTQSKPFACSECESSFVNSSGLKKHLRTHTGERPYQCGECKKSFKSSHNLRLHKLSHTKERRFQCDLCKRWFSYKNVLQTHMHVHRKGQGTCTESTRPGTKKSTEGEIESNSEG